MPRSILCLISLAALAMLAGCTDARTAQVASDDAQAISNLADAIPMLPAAELPAAANVLKKLAKDIGDTVGKPINQGTPPAAK